VSDSAVSDDQKPADKKWCPICHKEKPAIKEDNREQTFCPDCGARLRDTKPANDSRSHAM
jgi:rRNA maturation endonuclease Nob1